jgi:hypothetical protein
MITDRRFPATSAEFTRRIVLIEELREIVAKGFVGRLGGDMRSGKSRRKLKSKKIRPRAPRNCTLRFGQRVNFRVIFLQVPRTVVNSALPLKKYYPEVRTPREPS